MFKVIKVYRVNMMIWSSLLTLSDDDRNKRVVNGNRRSESGIVYDVIRGGTECVGAGTRGTSISSGQVSLRRSGVAIGECGSVCVLYTVCKVG